MEIINHILTGIKFRQTPNISGTRIVPRFLIIHFSGSGDLEGTVDHLTKKGSKKSAHLVIGRNGEMIQLASFDRRAWHCGESQWGQYKNLNDCSIGIEMENWGKLHTDRSGKYISWVGTRVAPDDVDYAQHRNEDEDAPWHKFTHAQIVRCKEVAAELVKTYNLEAILGHDDISPARKNDPGPLFPMDEVRAYCYEKKTDSVTIELDKNAARALRDRLNELEL